jgi:hypothetical protein
MRDISLLLHLFVTVFRLAKPGGVRSVIAQSVMLRHQLLILNRGRKRAPNLRFSDRLIPRSVYSLDATRGGPPDGNRPEALNSSAFPQRSRKTKVPSSLFSQKSE